MSLKNSSSVLHLDRLVGQSSWMLEVFRQIKLASTLNCPVLILGETGTGKELVAQAIHRCGSRRHKPFVPVDCSALSPSLFETEMFGCERGAYTDALANRVGLMQSAEDGTLFLDEIGNMRVGLQVKLLRAIQQREVRPVGSNSWVRFRARLISATNCDLEAAMSSGAFRQDLFYRLNVIEVHVPPLRNRREDIPVLGEYFVNKYSKQYGRDLVISPSAFARLVSHRWPGNVRELQNIVERAIALEEGPELQFEDFEPDVEPAACSQLLPSDGIETLAAIKSRTIDEALTRMQGNIVASAKVLGIGKTTLYRKLKERRIGVESARNLTHPRDI
jgi:two-component system, NtrC family, response regulator AtoC